MLEIGLGLKFKKKSKKTLKNRKVNWNRPIRNYDLK